MNNTTLIIDNNSISRNKLASLMTLKMPNLNLIAKTGDTKDGIALIKTKKPQLVFVNMEHLTAEHFMQLKKMKNSSLVFITSGFVEEQLDRLSNTVFENTYEKPATIGLKINDQIKKIPLNQIIRIEASSNYSLIYTTFQSKPILFAKSLKYFVDKIDSPQFIRPHNSHFVNKSFIQSYSKGQHACIILKDGIQISIARRRMKSIKNELA